MFVFLLSLCSCCGHVVACFSTSGTEVFSVWSPRPGAVMYGSASSTITNTFHSASLEHSFWCVPPWHRLVPTAKAMTTSAHEFNPCGVEIRFPSGLVNQLPVLWPTLPQKTTLWTPYYGVEKVSPVACALWNLTQPMELNDVNRYNMVHKECDGIN